MSKIAEGLKRLFDKHRIVLWYDALGDFTQEFNDAEFPDVIKCEIVKNEFALKYRMLIAEPKSKFLLYGKYDHPNADDNWLLDIELSNVVFHTDQEALTLQELELPIHFKSWIKLHLHYFKSKERAAKFVSNLEAKENEDQLTRTLIQTVFGSVTSTLDDILKSYVTYLANGKSDGIDKELLQYNLSDYIWSWIESVYQYKAKERSIYDFVLEVFQKNFSPTSKKASVNRTTEVLLASWKDARSFDKTYRQLVDRVENDLNISAEVNKLEVHELINDDVFECIDKQIIKQLASQLEQGNSSSDKIDKILKQRESCYWYDKYFEFYSSIRYANWLFDEISKYNNIKFVDYQDGFVQYTNKLFIVDQYYRKFIQHYRATNQNNVLNSLYQKTHRAYSNTWLLKLSDAWQEVIDSNREWYFGGDSQRKFFKRAVQGKYIEKDITIFVVISDALRFECGQELHDLFNQESRFSSKLEFQVTGLPSYTQLGMAALLPHESLSFGEGDSILIDSKNSIGAQARKKVLEEGSNVKATTILAEDLMKIASRSEEARRLVQDHQVVYVYHNRIDKTGDDKTSEDKVIEASKEEIEFLLEVTRKITNMNGNHVIITADHGFVYQNETLEESDFTDAQITGEIIKDNRRFVLGKNLSQNNNVVKYSAQSLQINSDIEVLIPKGINRLRKQGSGSRYVHGGSTLQEVVIPLLYVTKKRSDTVTKVDIDVLKGSNKITTNIQRVRFYQQQPIRDGIIARNVKSYFCVIEGEEKKVISDVFTYNFDSESNRPEEREVEYKFTISTVIRKSTSVYLIIEEQIDRSNKWNTLLKLPYSLNLAMENDFDDF